MKSPSPVVALVMPFLVWASCSVKSAAARRFSTTAFVTNPRWAGSVSTSTMATTAQHQPPQHQQVWYATSTSTKLAATVQAAGETTVAKSDTKKTPIILLAGFLGTGKTTTLKHLLENTDGARIGVIVNDVASVNIDAKLVSSMPDSGNTDMIELQNGCACCSLSDELFTSVETLFQPRVGAMKKIKNKLKKKDNNQQREYDAIVVELSGVADPMAIAATWKAAEGTDRFPATKRAEISKIITMIDSCTFGTDYMTWDAANQRPGWVDEGDDCAGNRKVAELLAEQVEAANLILVNKVDMAKPEEVVVASKVARALNDRATLHEVEFGQISPEELLKLGTTGVKTGPMENPQEKETAVVEDKLNAVEVDCTDPDCKDETHDHAHSHDHAAATDCTDPKCTDETHDHSHSHEHASASDCTDPKCTDETHDHSHSHDHGAATCSDPGCTDETHDHSHSHDHATSTDNLGIVNFVYRSTRPFSSHRLMVLLNTWPVPIKDTLDLAVLQEAQKEGLEMDDGVNKSPFAGVLRSKGFCWIGPSHWNGPLEDAYRHDTAMYWSHAGKHFGLAANGKWWSSIQLYEGWEAYMKKLFRDNIGEYERIMREDFVSDEFGDRRQELVFIGTDLDQAKITKALDDCLLTDEEMETYRQQLSNYQSAVLNATGGGKGLFDMDGSVEHTEVQ